MFTFASKRANKPGMINIVRWLNVTWQFFVESLLWTVLWICDSNQLSFLWKMLKQSIAEDHLFVSSILPRLTSSFACGLSSQLCCHSLGDRPSSFAASIALARGDRPSRSDYISGCASTIITPVSTSTDITQVGALYDIIYSLDRGRHRAFLRLCAPRQCSKLGGVWALWAHLAVTFESISGAFSVHFRLRTTTVNLCLLMLAPSQSLPFCPSPWFPTLPWKIWPHWLTVLND